MFGYDYGSQNYGYNGFNNGMGYNYKPPYNPYSNQPQFITKQVSNIDEAKAFIIDGINTYLFVDYQSGHIYMKRMANNGQSEFFSFSVDQPTKEVTVNPLDEINTRLANIEKKLGGTNDVSISESKSSKSDATANDTANAKK